MGEGDEKKINEHEPSLYVKGRTGLPRFLTEKAFLPAKALSGWEAMTFFQKLRIILTLPLILVLCSGCYEDRATLTVKPDGSGELIREVIISERLLLAIEESEKDPNSSMNVSIPLTEADLREKYGDCTEQMEVTSETLENGSRKLVFRGSFPDVLAITGSQKRDQETLLPVQEKACAEELGFSFRRDEETGIIRWRPQPKNSPMKMKPAQIYAMAQGLVIERTMRMPAAVESDSAKLSDNGKTVTWRIDLRDRSGFDATKALLEHGDEDQTVTATFPMQAVEFAPLHVLETVPEGQDDAATEKPAEQAAAPADAGDLSVSIVGTSLWWGIATVDAENSPFSEHQLDWHKQMELRWALEWPEGQRPLFHGHPVFEKIVDDTGKEIVQEDRRENMEETSERDKFIIEETRVLDVPAYEATKLAEVKGYLPVVVDIERHTATVINPLDKLGEAGLAAEDDPQLGKAGVVLHEIEGKELEARSEGNRILDVDLIKADGSRDEGKGGNTGYYGSTYKYEYTFENEIEEGDKLEIEIRVSDTVVNVPIDAKDVILP